MRFKQAIIIRDDLDMSKGKMIAQSCHASLGAYEKAPEKKCHEWKEKGAKKIVLNPGERKLEELHEEAKRNGIPSYMVSDAGMTELKPGTKTAVGIGPAKEDKIDTITGDLKLV